MSVPAAPAEPAAPVGAATAPPPTRRGPPGARRGRQLRWQPCAGYGWPTLLIAGAFCLVTFYAKGGLNLEAMTTTEIVLTLGGGRDRGRGRARARSGAPYYGAWSLGLLLAFTALTTLSIVWSVAAR